MKSLLFVIAFLVFQSLSAQTETIHFDVIHDGKPLGTLDASKTTEGDIVVYKSHTEIQYHLVVSIAIDYDYHVSFNNNELREAKALIKVKGTEKTNTKTIMTNSGYNFYSDNELQKNISDQIKHCIVQLLFKEPVGLTKIYSEEHGTFHTVKKIKDHSYLKTTASGHKSTYHYSDGILQRTDTDAGVIKFSIVRKQ